MFGPFEEPGLGQRLDDPEHDALGESNAASNLGDPELGRIVAIGLEDGERALDGLNPVPPRVLPLVRLPTAVGPHCGL